ncbi:MAG: TRAP transporter substrate-binding protein DctP [Candidatus Latescibacterota bacterium]
MSFFKTHRAFASVMTSIKALAAAGISVLLLTAPSAVSSAQKPKPELHIKFATLAPEGSTWMKTMRALDTELREKTENRIGFKFYTGGVQGDEKDVLRKMRNGQLHAGGFTGFGLGAIAPDVRVLELPFMFETDEEIDYVRAQMNELFSGFFTDNGFLSLGWADVGFIYMFSNSPIKSPADLQAVKMWIWSGDPLAELFFKAFDISPIPLSAPDVLTSLQTGIVNAVYASPLACVALQWFTRVKYMTAVPITHALGAVLISDKILAKASEGDVQILKDLSAKYMGSLNGKTRAQNKTAIESMKKEGVQVLTIDEAARNEFFTAGRSAWQDGVGQLFSQELLDQVQAILAEYRKSGK